MKRIKKHQFEAVSLLTVDNGLLDITVIPAQGQPDWIVPTNLILSVDAYDERIWTYLWQEQEVAVYQLIPKHETPDKIIVLEGNTDVHRIGLQTRGALKKLQVSITQMQDATPQKDYSIAESKTPQDSDSTVAMEEDSSPSGSGTDISPVTYAGEYQGKSQAYLYQTVKIDDVIYLVPDLDELAHRLVDLDS